MTIPLDPRFIPAFSIEDVLLDKDTGAPLSAGNVYFEEDNQRGILKPVYQITGTSPNYTFIQLPNPIVLSSIGTFEDSLGNPVIPYFFPYDADGNVDLYYIRVESSGGVPQFDRQAQPYISDGGEGSLLSAFSNELSNPQFAQVSFDQSAGTYTYNFNAASLQEVQIAPDWTIIVSSPAAGTVTVQQLTPVGDLNIPTNPGTILNINSTGLSFFRLRQRVYGSPNLWGSGFLSASFVAKTYSGTTVGLTLYYSQSNGVVLNEPLVAATLTLDGIYAAYSGSALIPISSSVDDFPNAYVDIEFSIPLSIEIDITSVMLAATGESNFPAIIYEQTSYARQVDHLFHYYQPQINYKPIPSLLTAWDFPLNPAQLGSTVTMTTTAGYIWDQTIGQSLVGNIAVIRNTVTGGFQATTANANEAFYQAQYLTGGQAQKILGTKLAVNINAFTTEAGGNCNIKVYLCRGSSGATFPTLPTALGTIDASGNFTLTAANWTVIPRSNLGQAQGTLNVINTANYSAFNEGINLGFNGWQITDSTQIADTNKFAIIVTYSCAVIATVTTVNSVSVVPGDIATIPAPQAPDEVMRECQYYYRKSFLPGVVPQTALGLNTGESDGIQAAGAASSSYGIFVKYDYPMRSTPTMTLYNPAAANAQIRNIATGTDWTLSTTYNVTRSGFSVQGTTPGGSAAGQGTAIHWQAEDRLGIVA